MRKKILRSANAEYHYCYLFFYEINKGDLPLMYSCVFWCEFIDLVAFFSCYCLNAVTLFIIRSKCSTEKQPGIRTLSTRKPIESQIFSTRGKLLSSLHRSKRFKAKYLHACCWKWTFPRATGSKIPSFSRHCEKRHLDTGRWLRGQQRKPRNKRFLLLFRFYRFWSFLFIVVIVISISLKTAFWQTSFHSQSLVKSL